MKTKLKPCKACGKNISENAEKCPQCGEMQQSAAVRIVLLIVLALLIIFLFFGGMEIVFG